MTTFSHFYAHIWSFDDRYRPHNQVACNFIDCACTRKKGDGSIFIPDNTIERFVVYPFHDPAGHAFQGARFDRLSVPLQPTSSATALFVLRWRRWRVAPEVVVARIAPNNTNRQIWQIPENTRSVFYFFSYFRQICRIPPLLETVSQFIFLSFRQKGEIFRHILIAAGELHLKKKKKIEPSLVFAFSLNSSDYS